MKNTILHHHKVTKKERSLQKKQNPCLIWFTGLSGSGKSTIAGELEEKLFQNGYHTYLLDGDNIRQGISRDLGFDEKSRSENIRRIGEISKLFVDSGLIVIAAFISPFEKDRQMVRNRFTENEYFEVYLSTSLKVCEKRDPKGLYKKARQGLITNFTGLGSHFEKPLKSDLILDSYQTDIETCVSTIHNALEAKSILLRDIDPSKDHHI